MVVLESSLGLETGLDLRHIFSGLFLELKAILLILESWNRVALVGLLIFEKESLGPFSPTAVTIMDFPIFHTF